MAAPKTIKDQTGNARSATAAAYGSDPSVPLNLATVAAAVVQCQNTLNEVAKRVNDFVAKFNAHTHVENTAGAYAQNASTAAPLVGQQAAPVDGTGAAAQNLFTAS